jgi:hypothetical protein
MCRFLGMQAASDASDSGIPFQFEQRKQQQRRLKLAV